MKIPCKDCISFAICNSKLSHSVFTFDLYSKCSIFKKYYKITRNATIEINNLFGRFDYEKQTRVKINENKI